MEKKLYIEKLFSDRREKLIDRCVDLQRQGKNFLYILPSREAIRQARYALLEKNLGILNSKVIMFDEFERDITQGIIQESAVIQEDIESLILSSICSDLKGSLKFFNKIANKKSFSAEVRLFIKALKRSCIKSEELKKNIELTHDDIIRDKLQDLLVIYEEYNKRLSENKIYDINDISLKAVELVNQYKGLKYIDAIIIDGFINIDKVNLELIREITSLEATNIYVNSSYKNPLTEAFLQEEITKPLEAMGFESFAGEESFYNIRSDFKELSNKLYSGEKISCRIENLTIAKYPCIACEVRETARDIKERLIAGEKAEDIAIFINDSEAYSKAMVSIFREFSIPLSLAQEVLLSDSEMVRELIRELENIEGGENTYMSYLQFLENNIDIKKTAFTEIIKEAFNKELDFEKMLELKAFEALRKLVSEVKQGFKLCGIGDLNMDKKSFLELMREYIKSTTITLKPSINSGVKVVNTDLAKGVFYKHIYVLGLNEGALPKIIKNDGLFDELEVLELKKVGISFEDYLWELCREKIRFNLTLATATESIYLSYRSSDEEGKFAIASSFIEEVKFISGLEETIVLSMRDRFEIPYNKVMSGYELKVRLLKKVFENYYRGGKALNIDDKIQLIHNHEKSIWQLLEKAMVEYHREKEPVFNKFEGILGEEFQKNGEGYCSFSPSKINSYLHCPFKYMLQHVFKLTEYSDEEEEYSALEIGQLYHQVLREYYRGVKQFDVFEEESFEIYFQNTINDLRKIEDKEEFEKFRKEKYEKLENFINQDIKRMASFKKVAGNVLKPYIIEDFIENTEAFGIPMKCKIDRVDLEYKVEGDKLTPTGRYVIYDYKKNSVPDIAEFLANDNCQLAIYYYFVEKHLKDTLKLEKLDCMAVLYLSVEKTNTKISKNGLYRTEYKKALDFTGANKFDIKEEIFYDFLQYEKLLIQESLEKIKGGVFNYRTKCECFDKFSHSYCDYDKLCRYSESKINAMAEEV